MQWRDINERDRKVLAVTSALATLLFAGLVISGLWHFVVYSPKPEDIRVENGFVFLDGRPLTASSAHGFFADLAVILTVFVAGWLSYHLLRRIAWAAFACLAVVVAAIVGGEQLTVNTLALRSGAPIGSTAITSYEVVRVPEPLWTVLHAASGPVLLLIIWFSWQYRDQPRSEPEPRWKLDFTRVDE